jgi:hypothetical protein
VYPEWTLVRFGTLPNPVASLSQWSLRSLAAANHSLTSLNDFPVALTRPGTIGLGSKHRPSLRAPACLSVRDRASP